MAIVSISLKDNLLREVDKLSADVGYSARSEVVRAGLRMLLEEHDARSKLAGQVDALLLLVHDEKSFEHISRIRGKYQSIVKTQLHSHLGNDKCLEVLLLYGDAVDIKGMAADYQSNKKIHNTKLVIL
ncbi:MAG: nickel-responsive regulator 1 [Candidatus Altiarchaeales archaeon ex4484_96]|nr:MAG: nickel-responsive regulator 1 [Candidatus Altiarchaeales archaeon ex4484_96]